MKRQVCCAALLLALVLAVACGQKTNVGDGSAAPTSAGQGSAGEVEAGDPGAAPGGVSGGVTGDAGSEDPGGTAGTSPAGPNAPATSTRRAGGSSAPNGGSSSPGRSGQSAPSGTASSTPATSAQATPSGGAGPDPGQPAVPAPGTRVDRTGVTDDVIKIGIHAPVTGAAPFPQNAFDKGKDVYWKYLAEKGGIHGRNVEIIFRDDQFNPSRAVQVCREMVEQEKVFALIGAAGSEQITACARYADSVGVPFLSGGVNEDGLTGLTNYFAVSLTYSQQSPLLAELVKNRIGKTKVAIVVNNTPALDEARRSATSEMEKRGLEIVRSSQVGKNASDSELLAEANALRTSGAEVVYLLTSPVNFIKLAHNAQAQAYNPVYIGPGVSNGLNVVAEAGCPSIGAAKFLSPFPQLDAIDELDRDFKPAYRKHAGGEADDIGLAEWGLNKVLHKMLEATGRDLSRESFLAALTSGQDFVSNVYPVVSYTGSTRFGADSMHLLEADCEARVFKTLVTFATGF